MRISIEANQPFQDDGTVRVVNSCERNGQQVTIEGTATEVDEDDDYGDEGVYR